MAGVWVAERTYHIVVAVGVNGRRLAMPTFSPPPAPHIILLALAIATATLQKTKGQVQAEGKRCTELSTFEGERGVSRNGTQPRPGISSFESLNPLTNRIET